MFRLKSESDSITPLLENFPMISLLIQSNRIFTTTYKSKSGLFITHLISSPTFCFLIYSVPVLLVSLLFGEQSGTLPQRDFIFSVSSTWRMLPQNLQGSFFISFRSLCKHHLSVGTSLTDLFQIATLPLP